MLTFSQYFSNSLKVFENLETAINESSIVSITDSEGKIQYVNQKFCEITGYTKEELIGKNQKILNSGYHDKSFFAHIKNTISKGDTWKGEIKNKKKDNSLYWIDSTIVPFLNEEGKPYQFISINHDITNIKLVKEKINQMAFNCPVTKLPNRNYLKNWIETNFSENKKEESISLLFIDFDEFKFVNDYYGHAIGDILLKKIGYRLKDIIPINDFTCRQGGDEFLIILRNKNKKQILSFINNLFKTFETPFFIEHHKLFVSISIGVSEDKINDSVSNPIDFFDNLTKHADNAMYRAKKQTGNSYFFNTDDEKEKQDRISSLEKEVKHALEKNEFYLEYQPLINLKDHKVIGVEVLLRWKNEQFGTIPPIDFIPLLEKSGLIVPVGKWIFNQTCKQILNWKKENINFDKISINVSPIQFRKKDFINEVISIINKYKIDFDIFEFEITEGVILNIKESIEIMHRIRNHGFKISIDDFGTGYSSLSYLKHLPIDTIKIDKSFMSDLDESGKIIVNTIIKMAQSLDFNVIAEGIENENQLLYLKEQDCIYGQGYYFSKPTSPDEIKLIYMKQKNTED